MENSNQTEIHRNHWKWIITVIVAVLIILSFKWIWPGHHYDHDWHHGRGGYHWMDLSESEMNKRMKHGAQWAFKKLDTTDEQEEVITDALKGLTPTVLKLQGERLELKNRFRAVLEQDQVDREAFSGLMEEVKELIARSLDEGMESFITIWETLTTEQREEVLEHWKDKG